MKHIKKILAMVLVAGGVASVAGCSSGTVYSSTSTSANWNVATSTTVEKNSIDFWRNHREIATYSIGFNAPEANAGNSTYRVEYYNTSESTPNYATCFYMDKADYNWGTDTHSDFKIVSEDGTSPQDPVYVYETLLTIKGRYVLKSTQETVEFEDRVYTICKYRLAGENLKPVYSRQEVKSTSPNTLNASTAASMSVEVNAVYETYYNRDCSKAIVETTDFNNAEKSGKKEIALSGLVFDNSQLAFALRSFSLDGTKSISVCTPQNGNSQGVTVSCSTAAELNATDNAQIINALKNVTDGNGNPVSDYIFFDGTSSDPETAAKQVRFHNVTLGITSDMKGSTPVYSYAAVENADINTTRSVLLNITTPLSFGLGTLSYTLESLSVVNF